MSFGRRTWDREEYAENSSAVSPKQSLLLSLDEDQLRALKHRYTNFNASLEYNLKDVNKKTLSANVSHHKKGKQFGFYCELCDLTFKDTLQFINHLNHKSHTIRFENIFDEPLIQDTRDNDLVPVSDVRSQFHKSVTAFIRENEPKSFKPKPVKRAKLDRMISGTQPEPESDIHRFMGFTEFGSSKKL
ncbi:unnamed protein product [Kluyveromyces dobzhanskii CBS 2104]|uniref:WGS project CCBQ000000000 data, contig 00106 n=1 Tax=Kluyveromyces dobzhanskii CBS 2104 TaxID=1427455 RepID=A0A0A8L7J2_9SACH|nr:unnamed protein product [Kluyveromyces dobzhanskii CBS 2104]